MTHTNLIQQPKMFEFELSFATLIVAISYQANFPAIGGMRRISYNSIEDARKDCQFLANGMLKKAKHHELDLSGGKAVIYCSDENWQNHRIQIIQEAALKIHSLDGKYITAIDMGTTTKDMDHISLITPHVCSNSDQAQTAYATALGVYYGITTSCHYLDIDLSNSRILIEGLGQVTQHLAPMLKEHGATLYGYDINPDKISTFSDQIEPYRNNMDYDIFVPNACGHTINNQHVNSKTCQLICGAANNQLSPGTEPSELDAYWVPDHIVNSGGLIFVYTARQTSDAKARLGAVEKIKQAVQSHFASSIHHQHAN